MTQRMNKLLGLTVSEGSVGWLLCFGTVVGQDTVVGGKEEASCLAPGSQEKKKERDRRGGRKRREEEGFRKKICPSTLRDLLLHHAPLPTVSTTSP